jgi:hypothetical protein
MDARGVGQGARRGGLAVQGIGKRDGVVDLPQAQRRQCLGSGETVSGQTVCLLKFPDRPPGGGAGNAIRHKAGAFGIQGLLKFQNRRRNDAVGVFFIGGGNFFVVTVLFVSGTIVTTGEIRPAPVAQFIIQFSSNDKIHEGLQVFSFR